MQPSQFTPESKLDTPLKRWIPANRETLLVLLILVLAVVSRFYGLGARAVSHDEVNHVVPAYDLYNGHGYKYDPLSHGPLQFHLMALSYTLFGDSDFTSRIPAAVFSVVTVALALLLFRPYLGRIGALAAGVMFLISPFMLFYGRYARNEAYIVFWGMLTIYTMLRYLEKGERRILLLFTLINALHFTDKATSYIFAAEELIFLAVYFIGSLSRRQWPQERKRSTFLVALAAAIVLFASAAFFYLSQQPPDQPTTFAIAVLGVMGLGMLVYAAVEVVRGLGWEGVHSERSFDLLMMLGTLILPLLNGLPLKLVSMYLDAHKMRSFDLAAWGTNSSTQIAVGVAALVLAGIAIPLGLWWFGRRWLLHAALFYIPFVVLYTSFFTNPVGLFGGFVGALSYWMIQERGSQPLYYYALLQVPVYEFLPALGTICAALIAIFKHLWQSEPARPFVSGRTAEGEARQVPTVALTAYWSLSSLVAFSLAGEKMPWLTTHIAMPMILATGWTIGWLGETAVWGKVKAWGARTLGQAAALAFFGLLAIITVRTSFRAAFINYDYPLEYLVYAHGAPDPKALFNQIDEISRRTTGGLDLVVAYDNNVRYPYWWYMRHFPSRIDFDVNPTRELRRATVIVVSSENYDKIAPVVRNDYVEAEYMRLWWPNQDYWNLKWDTISNERTTALTAKLGQGTTIPPMNFFEYLKYAWLHIRPFFTNSKVASAVWQIWFNRDYTEWAALKNDDSFTLTNWGVADRMRFYVRKDVAAQIWSYGAAAQTVSQPVDPYAELTLPFTPDATLGTQGTEAGQFQSPRAIALAPDGSLYVVDSLNHRIQHLSPNGEILHTWGTFADISKGAAPGGTFNEPWGVAVGPDGSVYVADTWNHRIQKFSAEGEFLTMWGHGPTDTADGFYGPRGIAVDAQGHVFVTDTGNKRILIFDSNGNLLSQFGGPGMGEGQFDEPVGIAMDASGKVYVSDTWNQRVQVFSAEPGIMDYTMVTQWPVEGWYGQSVENKPFIAVDAAGNSFVTDPEACRVIEFSPVGKALHAWGSCGGADSFNLPDGLALDGSDGLWVSDAGKDTIVHFKVGGQ